MTGNSRFLVRSFVFLILVSAICLAPESFAQEAEPEPAGANAAAAAEGEPVAAELNPSMWGLIVNSGWTGLGFMAILALFSLAGATVAIERTVNTTRKKVVAPQFGDELRSELQSDDPTRERFESICLGYDAPVAKVMRAGLVRCGRPLPEVEKSMEDAAARELATLRGKIRPLSVIGNTAPLVGLLGTVLGMIIAFRTASQVDLGKGQLMAQGIYMALLTTAAGLSIAIPCLLLAARFNAKSERFFREIDEQLIETMPWFARMEIRAMAVGNHSLETAAESETPVIL